jgi:excisionase family DNA binding protein
MAEQHAQPEWWTAQELAKRWRLSDSQIRRMCDRKDVVAKKMGDQWRIHVTAIEAYEADGKPQPKPAAAKRPDLREFDQVTQYV